MDPPLRYWTGESWPAAQLPQAQLANAPPPSLSVHPDPARSRSANGGDLPQTQGHPSHIAPASGHLVQQSQCSDSQLDQHIHSLLTHVPVDKKRLILQLVQSIASPQPVSNPSTGTTPPPISKAVCELNEPQVSYYDARNYRPQSQIDDHSMSSPSDPPANAFDDHEMLDRIFQGLHTLTSVDSAQSSVYYPPSNTDDSGTSFQYPNASYQAIPSQRSLSSSYLVHSHQMQQFGLPQDNRTSQHRGRSGCNSVQSYVSYGSQVANPKLRWSSSTSNSRGSKGSSFASDASISYVPGGTLQSTMSSGSFTCQYAPCDGIFPRKGERDRHERSHCEHNPNKTRWTCLLDTCTLHCIVPCAQKYHSLPFQAPRDDKMKLHLENWHGWKDFAPKDIPKSWMWPFSRSKRGSGWVCALCKEEFGSWEQDWKRINEHVMACELGIEARAVRFTTRRQKRTEEESLVRAMKRTSIESPAPGRHVAVEERVGEQDGAEDGLYGPDEDYV
ncbi:uncharacterized protein BDR25DRAFT_339592 [Lindgomyces ingoldianus]|uniref:Uncharacterized protein n=1 Tax=Lindgomyces ingoldianus TaxID=673940 RepID=A0ACB6REA0_9PLEO|nr:uncharacterized protein BDR25DRAFT_339592 [Lindgomyces ingoldianus]KAF2476645.1 hypothetical protein BDR25DRAFT_339592 [Lindgomyces ingoldianus]